MLQLFVDVNQIAPGKKIQEQYNHLVWDCKLVRRNNPSGVIIRTSSISHKLWNQLNKYGAIDDKFIY
jgi:hypothetical protein